MGESKRTWSLRLSPETISVIENIMSDVKMEMVRSQKRSWSISEEEIFKEVLKEFLRSLKTKDKARYENIVKSETDRTNRRRKVL
ncbi:MAG: hypothetical protein M1503_03190 [Thaumarchaeota archaeon]|nr:hypothetical protein [Nitrososphaerota archaeon]